MAGMRRAWWGGEIFFILQLLLSRQQPARAGFSHSSFTFPSALGVRCQCGPRLLASSQGMGKWKGLLRPSWSFSDPDIKHNSVLVMHFVLLLCEPRVYKPAGRSASSSSQHHQPRFWLQVLLRHAPLSCRWVSTAHSSLLSY